jgi:hypothetical protein
MYEYDGDINTVRKILYWPTIAPIFFFEFIFNVFGVCELSRMKHVL